ncbi:MAG TPA: DUF2059 domain-containing protein [Terriglobales bacterium]|nr:DUF2059 domain-containing protein [Terriglobales bacterium]
MRRFLLPAILCLSFCCCAFAQQSDNTPATKEDVQRYFDALHLHAMMTQMIDAMAKPMHQMIHDQYEKEKDKLPDDFEEQMNKMMDGMFKDMPWDEMIQAMVPAYQKHLTKGDIDAIVAFYSTGAGQKLLRESPAMMAESMQAMMPIMQKYMEKVQGRIQEQTVAMMKQGEKKSDQSPKN